jgi:hypothetical protein
MCVLKDGEPSAFRRDKSPPFFSYLTSNQPCHSVCSIYHLFQSMLTSGGGFHGFKLIPATEHHFSTTLKHSGVFNFRRTLKRTIKVDQG